MIFKPGDLVRINDEWWEKGVRPNLDMRRDFTILEYDQPRGCVKLVEEPHRLSWYACVFEHAGGPW